MALLLYNLDIKSDWSIRKYKIISKEVSKT